MAEAHTVVLTGATGFLGSHLTRSLLAAGHKVIILKRSTSNTRRIDGILSKIPSYDVDRCGLEQAFREGGPVCAVIHLATCYGRHGETPTEILEANTGFPLRLLEAASSHGVRHFFNADSYFTKAGLGYGYLSGYTLSKKQFVEWGRQFEKAHDIRFINLRLEHMYGSDDDDAKFVAHVINSCLNNLPELRLTQGEQTRDFIYVDDVVAAFVLLLEQSSQREKLENDYDVGTGQATSVRECVELIHRITESTTGLMFGALPYRDGEIMESVADIERLTRLGWSPRYNLEEGLRQTISRDHDKKITCSHQQQPN